MEELKGVTLFKLGGHEIADDVFLTGFAQYVHDQHQPTVIVHGGGKEISALQEQLGIEPRYLDGVRVTDEASLAMVEMVLCGVVNKRLVRYLVKASVEAFGMSGVDRGLILAEKMPHETVDMAFTGEVVAVRGEVLEEMLVEHVTPVIAPVCYGTDHNYNVNADHVAAAVAVAVGAAQVVFLTNVEGVLVDDAVQAKLTVNEAEARIADGTIHGGMIPKVRSALDVLSQGVPSVVITSLEGLRTHGGTVFSK